MFVFEQGAHQWRHRDLLVGALQGFERDVFGHQQFQPVQQLAGRGLFLQAGQAAHVIKRLERQGQQVFFEGGEVHIHDLAHGVRFGELDVVEEAAAQESVRQLLFVVGGDEHQGPGLGLDQLARLVAIKLHAVDLAQQVVREFDVGFVDLVDQDGHRGFRGEGLPEHTFDDVVLDVLDLLLTQLAVAQAAHGVVFVQALLCFGGRFDVPLQQRQA